MVIGGITAQEVVKGVCKQYTPIEQWLYFDALQLIDKDQFLNDRQEYEVSDEVFFFYFMSKIMLFLFWYLM